MTWTSLLPVDVRAFWLALYIKSYYPPCPGCGYYYKYCRCEQPVYWGLS